MQKADIKKLQSFFKKTNAALVKAKHPVRIQLEIRDELDELATCAVLIVDWNAGENIKYIASKISLKT